MLQHDVSFAGRISLWKGTFRGKFYPADVLGWVGGGCLWLRRLRPILAGVTGGGWREELLGLFLWCFFSDDFPKASFPSQDGMRL